MVNDSDLVVDLKVCEKHDEHIVGTQAVELGILSSGNFLTPAGLVLTKAACKLFFKENNLHTKVKHLLGTVNMKDPNSLSQVSYSIKKIIESSAIPDEIVQDFFKKFQSLDLDTVVIFTSLGATQRKNNSFTKEYRVKGESSSLEIIKRYWSQSYSPHEIIKMHDSQKQEAEPFSIIVQKMVFPEKSGVMLTTAFELDKQSYTTIDAVAGSNLRQDVLLDAYEVKKPSVIYSPKLSSPDWQISKKRTVGKQVLTDSEVLKLARIGQDVEDYLYFPQKVSWGIKGDSIYIFSTRFSSKENVKETDEMDLPITSENTIILENNYAEVVCLGKGVGRGVGVGRVKIINKNSDLVSFQSGMVLVSSLTNQAYENAFKKAAGVITLEKRLSSYTAQHAKDFGIPAVIDVQDSFQFLKDGMLVTVDGNTGEIWSGSKKNPTVEHENKKTATKIYTNQGLSMRILKNEADGVFPISIDSVIKKINIHPKKLLYESKLSELEEELETFLSEASLKWYPYPVYYKFSDLSSDEYRSLEFGRDFEEEEKNPLLGYRGLMRAISEPYLFDLELRVLNRLRAKKMVKNIHLVFPFVRSKKELEQVLRHLERNKFRKSFMVKKVISIDTPESAIFISDFLDLDIDEVFINIGNLISTAGGLDVENQEQIHSRIRSLGVFLELIQKESNFKNVPVGAYNIPRQLHEKFVEELITHGVHMIAVDEDFLASTKKIASGVERAMLKGLHVK